MAAVDFILNLGNIQTVLLCICVGLITHFIFHRFRYNYPPGPWALPVIGNLQIYKSKFIHRKVAKLGPAVTIHFGPIRTIFLNRLEEVIEALVKKKTDFANRPKTNSFEMLSDGGKDIACSPYSATWKFQKKVAGKALRHYLQGTHLETMINDVCDRVFEKIAVETKPFVIRDYLRKLIIHMLYNMCFNKKRDLDDPILIQVLKNNSDLLDMLGSRFIEDFMPFWLTKYCSTQRWKRFNGFVNYLMEFLRKEIKEHMDTFDPNNIRDFTDSLLFAREEAKDDNRRTEFEILSDVHVSQTIADVFRGGFDTLTTTLDWFISFMVEHQECQVKCQKEIDEVVGSNRSPGVGDRDRLCYTEACIMESMRLGTVSALGFPHQTICDTSVGGYNIPKDTMVFINHWALHNDPTVWKDVEKFNPHRYLDKEGKMDMKPENWLPFSAGRRICLGEPVVRTELLLMVAKLLQNFRFKAPSGVEFVVKAHAVVIGVEAPADYKVVIEKRK